jgi:hypothetical protein
MDVVYARPGTRPGARLPQELERALAGVKLSGDQEQKVQAIIQQYGEKQRQLRDELLRQLKTALDAEQYAKVEGTIRHPPPPPAPGK